MAPLLAVPLLCACATTSPESESLAGPVAEERPAPIAAAGEEEEEPIGNPDPLERVNRPVFWFNHGLDRALFEPLAIGWTWITPEVFRVRLGKAFDNLGFPVRFVNNFLQADVKQTGRELGRFVVNSTVGLAGFFDPATGWGLEKRDEDFGQTLGWWGLPAGPYLVLPLLGPSGARDGVGLAADAPLRPRFWFWFLFPPELINTRALLLDDIRELRRSSLDYYVSVRNAYTQYRRALVVNGEVETEPVEEDLYEVFDEED
jgi:phospholipid-binding lipoprotein MlaA